MYLLIWIADGKILYQTALFHLGSISTYYHEASDKAKRVWKSLMKSFSFNENFFEQILTIKNTTHYN